MKQDRKFELILYPDATNYDYNTVILSAQKFFDYWAFVVHDMDRDENGDPIKPHVHFIGKKETIITPKGVCYQLQVPEQNLANIKYWKSAVRYLIHHDQPDKYQYLLESVSSNFDLSVYFKEALDEADQANQIFKKIASDPTLTEFKLIEWVLDNQLWATYRRGYSVWHNLLTKG